jgi:hypothetical protein
MSGYVKLAKRLAQGFDLKDDLSEEIIRIGRSINEIFLKLNQGKINNLQAKQALKDLLPGPMNKHPDFTVATDLLIGHAMLYASTDRP